MTSLQENNNASLHTEEERDQLLCRVPKSVARRLRTYAAQNDTTIQSVIEGLVMSFLAKKRA
jgi:hypothetical protein